MTLVIPFASYPVTLFAAFAIPLICVFGIVGNIFVIIIFTPTAKRSINSLFLVALAFSDIFSLLAILPSSWLDIVANGVLHHGNEQLNNILYTPPSCQIRPLLNFATKTNSIWIIVLNVFTNFNRLHKGRQAEFSTVLKQLFILAVVSILMSLFNLVAFDEVEIIKDNCTNCSITVQCRQNYTFQTGRIISICLHSIIPFILLAIGTINIVKQLKNFPNSTESQFVQRKVESFRLMLISLVFFILTFPYLVIVSIHTHHEYTNSKNHLTGAEADLFVISLVLFTIHFGINCILYSGFQSLFRKAAILMIRGHYRGMSAKARQLVRYVDTGSSDCQSTSLQNLKY